MVGISIVVGVPVHFHYYCVQSISGVGDLSFYDIVLCAYFFNDHNGVKDFVKLVHVGFLVLRVSWGGAG